MTVMMQEKPSPARAEPPPPAEAVISIQGISKSFGSHTVLQDITFDVPRGKTSAVLGPSGTGKSVLLKVVIGLLAPDAGQVYIDGDPIVGVREKEVLRIRRKIGVLFQDGALFGSMNLFDNIAFPLVEHTNKTDKEVRSLVLRKSELVGLVDHLHKLPGEVSGGMRKRAGLARALVLEPRILFFDEPDSGLDPVRVAYLDDLINTVHEETGATFFIISHNIESVKRTAHYLGLLFRTKLVGFGSKDEMINSTVPVIEQFLAGRPEGPISMDEMADAEVAGSARPEPSDGFLGSGSLRRTGDVVSGVSDDPEDPYPEDPGRLVSGDQSVAGAVQ
ncbi:MAG TPA: ATP-binding cassette domain-containing protein [Acidimicrobiales bacterium]|jgi:phospholipid/cholesterol/gamma-HCH transport system ATP-binding protein